MKPALAYFFFFDSRCAAAAAATAAEKAIWACPEAQVNTSHLSFQDTLSLCCPSWPPAQHRQSCTWDAGWKTSSHVSICRLDALTWYFVLSDDLLTPKTKDRSCEQHWTPYLCYEDERFRRWGFSLKKCCLAIHVLTTCWCLISRMNLIRGAVISNKTCFSFILFSSFSLLKEKHNLQMQPMVGVIKCKAAVSHICVTYDADVRVQPVGTQLRSDRMFENILTCWKVKISYFLAYIMC